MIVWLLDFIKISLIHPRLTLFTEKVSNDDIVRVSKLLLASRPAVAAMGDLKHMPKYGDIENALSSGDGKLSKKFRLFGS